MISHKCIIGPGIAFRKFIRRRVHIQKAGFGGGAGRIIALCQSQHGIIDQPFLPGDFRIIVIKNILLRVFFGDGSLVIGIL